MPRTKAEEKVEYGFVKLPVDLIAEVDDHVGKHGYRSRTEIVKEAIRRLLITYPEDSKPELEHFNLNDQGVIIVDRKLDRIIQVYFRPDKVVCEVDGEKPCKHKDFALQLVDVQKILREKGLEPQVTTL